MNTSSILMEKQITDNQNEIAYLQFQNRQLKAKAEANKNAKGIEQWNGYNFESSSGLTEEFAAFAKDFKKYIQTHLPENAELVNFNRGHFYCSGFIKRDEKFVYFSISDVRGNESWKNFLVRTAKHDKDYTGGSNDWTSLENFTSKVEKLLNY